MGYGERMDQAGQRRAAERRARLWRAVLAWLRIRPAATWRHDV